MAGNKLVTIKGTRDGLTLFLNDQCSWDDILLELEEILSAKHMMQEEHVVSVKVELGNRYITKEQEERLAALIRKYNKLEVGQIVSNVMLRKEALKWKEETDIHLYNKIVRSGQVLQVKGDLLLVGDVNPGGRIIATGNIFVMGNLRGIAHAGFDGNRDAIIAASHMAPSQLRIAEMINRADKMDEEGTPMECGLIDADGEQIIMDRISVISRYRSDLDVFERRIMNG
ncbi:septum site-determining protein MinC [Gracilibacillus alcaliphilus]|uniref:septum site-determining protein MinC n=1 Tax=Gracilibacillus alcaliphilus TaxID=1401441 RepID=UPI001956E802|nr:septum site-determining protein MinC [Gracilibacillus alcaliphilus]MBM7678559.1 septum site-determining protein MinC [Gracilibacillus alcaliphilus]